MAKFNKPDKKNKPKVRKKKHSGTKYYCELCEKMEIDPKKIRVRKNYPFGKKSKARITITHKIDGGPMIVLKSKKKKEL